MLYAVSSSITMGCHENLGCTQGSESEVQNSFAFFFCVTTYNVLQCVIQQCVIQRNVLEWNVTSYV